MWVLSAVFFIETGDFLFYLDESLQVFVSFLLKHIDCIFYVSPSLYNIKVEYTFDINWEVGPETRLWYLDKYQLWQYGNWVFSPPRMNSSMFFLCNPVWSLSGEVHALSSLNVWNLRFISNATDFVLLWYWSITSAFFLASLKIF